ncbi:hypothetical protein PFICI_01408 [Pestalotiopsis fici W106-1]|uniref:Uncharacterized protein n=1 Tax=Pestalotiopsis fici (strain W106-1 / CGMCC3.15140) TaxID=1229662 RepID=W3XNP8_PESFW|nr:uncharacterized protein PFICI_01408 [Pestalotiopsis fici W106-1]ETS87580.1 hypothetical protein PFICI_01408 [Pestalotiopsis fici W106-1]
MIVSCFGEPPKRKTKKSTKPKQTPSRKPSKLTVKYSFTSDPDRPMDLPQYTMMPDGTWHSNKYPSYVGTQAEWTAAQRLQQHQDTLNSTLAQIKKTEESMAKLHGSVGDLKKAQAEQAKAHDAHAQKQNECLAEVQKVYNHLDSAAKQRNERKKMQEWQRQLVREYDEGREAERQTITNAAQIRKEEETAATLRAVKKEWEAEKQEILKRRQQQQHEEEEEARRQAAESHAKELRALREEIKTEREVALEQQQQLNAQRKADEEALERALQRRRRIEEEDRQRQDRVRSEAEDRYERLTERVLRQRHPEREASTTTATSAGSMFDRERRPYWAGPVASSRRGRPVQYVEYYPYEYMPWVEETVEEEEEFPSYYVPSPGHKGRRRTTLRGSGRRAYHAWDY